MKYLSGKQILLGVTGGVAAYKAADLTRLLVRSGAQVRVVMTRAATEFVTPLTFQSLSGNPVYTGFEDSDAANGIGHIELARWADRILIAPATANCMAKLAHGRADDLLSTLCLASEAPILLAPAMNRVMWEKPVTQQNIHRLMELGMQTLGPSAGEQACGETGMGRLLEPQVIAEALSDSFASDLLAGLHVLITAGPTREPIDAVRYISNRSSGKMGYALAAAAREAGARVTLVSGPVSLPTPDGVTRIVVETAQQMGQSVLDRVDDCQILIGAAAVADYVPSRPQQDKMKKQARSLSLELLPSIDIMQAVGELPRRPFTVGFAAETENLAAYAREKRQRKAMDMIAANRVDLKDRGFDADDNELAVYWDGGERLLPLTNKNKLARQLIEVVGKRFHAQDSTENPG